ncbi:MAG: hypothetical protein VYA48_09300, partial [Gemmatimonadota bacterium]|nr:hypothetical protein [Gemmatimonadota bacterium]
MSFKHRVRRGFTVLLAAALGLAVSAAAEAARHDVRGCIFLLDDREFSPTFGDPVPVQGVEIEFDYTVGPATHTAIPIGTPPATNASGCFSVRLTLVPANTTITARMVLNRVADRKVLNSDGDTYAFELSSVSVTGNGQNVDYGDVVGASGGSNDPVLMWVNATDAQSHYSDFAGPYGNQGFRQLRVEFPTAADGGSHYTRGDHTIHIVQGNRSRFKTFMHEFGHFIAGEDSTSSGTSGDYCQGPSETMYPFAEVPYDYIDPDLPDDYVDGDPCPDAGHHDESWEHETRAMPEGFADFVGD